MSSDLEKYSYGFVFLCFASKEFFKMHILAQKWMANMLGFMKKTKHMRHESEGVYLSELNFDDPEISSLYLSTLQDRHQNSQGIFKCCNVSLFNCY